LKPVTATLAIFCCTLVLTACGGVQSALDPAGREAERIAQLFFWVTIAAAVIWAAVVALAAYAPRARAPHSARRSTAFIVGGGVVFPVVVLTVHLVYGLAELPPMLAPAPEGSLTIDVSGSQWWWRVRYQAPGQAPVELANELRLPVGHRVNVRLVSADVIHSFWIPSLTGKLDMIPGRVNRLALEPTRTGVFRGACAEYCGTSHARMNFMVVVTEQQEFDAWLAAQAQPASPPSAPLPVRGQAEFFERGCNTCHTVRGTSAHGRSGPDLTHLRSRHTIAAGRLPTGPDEIRRWIAGTELLKPGAHMPAFATLPDDVLTALAAYLAELK
jgi:cytochrome c oxidase subunit 2